MPIPTARVKVEILQVSGLPSITLIPNATRYLTARFYTIEPNYSKNIYFTGRSKPIPAAGGTFDPSTEGMPWSFEANMNPNQLFFFVVESCEDRGDLAPPLATPLNHDTRDAIADPWTSGERMIAGFRGVSIKIRVTTTLINPTDKAFLARATEASKVSAVLTMPQGYFVEIVDILGLYQPNPTIVTGRKSSKHVTGYLSGDNQGRIFTNRLPDGTWAKDRQFIDVQVKVTAFGGATLPAGAKVDWILVDMDDPTNEAPNFHRDWGRYVDANDYDAAGNPIGAQPGDNAGAYSAKNTDPMTLFGSDVGGSPNARWANAEGGPSPSASSLTEATTDIAVVTPQTGTSAVRIHCMNVLGTNLVLRALLIGTPDDVPIFGAFTGIMTMWSRIDVEVVRMQSAESIRGALLKIPRYFFPACVQMDFQTEAEVVGELLDREEMSTTDDITCFEAATLAWVGNKLVFTHAGDPGWFFLGAARWPYSPGAASKPLAKDPDYKFTTNTLVVDEEVPTADYVDVSWDAGGKRQNTSFFVNRTNVSACAKALPGAGHPATPPLTVADGGTTMKLFGNDVTPGFTGHDANGSESHAYESTILYFARDQKRQGSPFSPGGFHVPDKGAELTIFGRQGLVGGVSPGVENTAKPDERFFAGRTVIFTQVYGPKEHKTVEDQIVETAVHELTHAFGLPHKCGSWDWQAPRVTSCCMNYFNTWLIDNAGQLLPNTVNKQAANMCGRHLMEIRRVHLEKNLGLNW